MRAKRINEIRKGSDAHSTIGVGSTQVFPAWELIMSTSPDVLFASPSSDVYGYVRDHMARSMDVAPSQIRLVSVPEDVGEELDNMLGDHDVIVYGADESIARIVAKVSHQNKFAWTRMSFDGDPSDPKVSGGIRYMVVVPPNHVDEIKRESPSVSAIGVGATNVTYAYDVITSEFPEVIEISSGVRRVEPASQIIDRIIDTLRCSYDDLMYVPMSRMINNGKSGAAGHWLTQTIENSTDAERFEVNNRVSNREVTTSFITGAAMVKVEPHEKKDEEVQVLPDKETEMRAKRILEVKRSSNALMGTGIGSAQVHPGWDKLLTIKTTSQFDDVEKWPEMSIFVEGDGYASGHRITKMIAEKLKCDPRSLRIRDSVWISHELEWEFNRIINYESGTYVKINEAFDFPALDKTIIVQGDAHVEFGVAVIKIISRNKDVTKSDNKYCVVKGPIK